MRCPTCRAVQEWSDECRRCKSDLTLLRTVWEEATASRERALRALRAGELVVATRHALRAHDLNPGADSRRLLAVCALLRKDWNVAIAHAHRVSP